MTDNHRAPLFSIITITRNNRDGLKKTASSVMAQTSDDVEWIIIDGASTDGTQNDFKNYTAAIIISEPDNGLYDAMNKGIEKSTGDYLIFMNAGDCFADNNVLSQITPLTHSSPALIYGDSLEGGFYKKARPASSIRWGLFTHHQAMFYARRALESLRYDTTYKVAADYDLTLRFIRLHPSLPILYAPFPVCVFEQGGLSQQQAKRGRDEQFLARQATGITPPLFNHSIRVIQHIAWVVRCNLPALYWLFKKKL